ncbi:hypothetical protein NPIL_35411 [Nephila pilipes]|uniref:Uncharacterized protein n=1 Tax=Nephila pilipes TaxID=299642 RepID=A0A8X6UBX9_NEPPI|nr:hypothetical protein NPIL_35411 [Nephila pilipes]
MHLENKSGGKEGGKWVSVAAERTFQLPPSHLQSSLECPLNITSTRVTFTQSPDLQRCRCVHWACCVLSRVRVKVSILGECLLPSIVKGRKQSSQTQRNVSIYNPT